MTIRNSSLKDPIMLVTARDDTEMKAPCQGSNTIRLIGADVMKTAKTGTLWLKKSSGIILAKVKMVMMMMR